MKAATSELNLTVITIIAIGAVLAFFWAFWPTIQNTILGQWNNATEDKDNGGINSIGYITSTSGDYTMFIR